MNDFLHSARRCSCWGAASHALQLAHRRLTTCVFCNYSLMEAWARFLGTAGAALAAVWEAARRKCCLINVKQTLSAAIHGRPDARQTGAAQPIYVMQWLQGCVVMVRRSLVLSVTNRGSHPPVLNLAHPAFVYHVGSARKRKVHMFVND